MSQLLKIIDAYKDAHGQPSDSSIARAIGIKPQTLSSWRTRGIKEPPDRAALRELARVARLDYESVVLRAALIDSGWIEDPSFDASLGADQARRIVGQVLLGYLEQAGGDELEAARALHADRKSGAIRSDFEAALRALDVSGAREERRQLRPVDDADQELTASVRPGQDQPAPLDEDLDNLRDEDEASSRPSVGRTLPSAARPKSGTTRKRQTKDAQDLAGTENQDTGDWETK